jgi:hypothetical protein
VVRLTICSDQSTFKTRGPRIQRRPLVHAEFYRGNVSKDSILKSMPYVLFANPIIELRATDFGTKFVQGNVNLFLNY